MGSSAINGTCYNCVPEYTIRNKVVHNNGQQATEILCSVSLQLFLENFSFAN